MKHKRPQWSGYLNNVWNVRMNKQALKLQQLSSRWKQNCIERKQIGKTSNFIIVVDCKCDKKKKTSTSSLFTFWNHRLTTLALKRYEFESIDERYCFQTLPVAPFLKIVNRAAINDKDQKHGEIRSKISARSVYTLFLAQEKIKTVYIKLKIKTYLNSSVFYGRSQLFLA